MNRSPYLQWRRVEQQGHYVLFVDFRPCGIIQKRSRRLWFVNDQSAWHTRLLDAKVTATRLAVLRARKSPLTLRDHLIDLLFPKCGSDMASALLTGKFWLILHAFRNEPDVVALIHSFQEVIACQPDAWLNCLVQDAVRDPSLLGILSDAAQDAGLSRLESATRACMAFLAQRSQSQP